jgi:hypothetical protein
MIAELNINLYKIVCTRLSLRARLASPEDSGILMKLLAHHIPG